MYTTHTKYIALGRQCDTVFNIKKYTQPDGPTQFFDWSRTDFKSVLDVLDMRDVDAVFAVDNLRLDFERFAKDGDLTICLKSFEAKGRTLMYHHDAKIADCLDPAGLEKTLGAFIGKYKRRFRRLVHAIRDPDARLCFVYRVSYDKDSDPDKSCAIDLAADVPEFDRVLRQINPDVVYCLVLLIEEEEEYDYMYTKYRNVLRINMSYFLRRDAQVDWMATRFDMETVHGIIRQNAFSNLVTYKRSYQKT